MARHADAGMAVEPASTNPLAGGIGAVRCCPCGAFLARYTTWGCSIPDILPGNTHCSVGARVEGGHLRPWTVAVSRICTSFFLLACCCYPQATHLLEP